MLLDKIQKENDIKKISQQQLPQLAQEIREILVRKANQGAEFRLMRYNRRQCLLEGLELRLVIPVNSFIMVTDGIG